MNYKILIVVILIIIFIKFNNKKKIDTMTNVNKNDYIIVKNNRNDILYYGEPTIDIDWDWIYSNYGYDNYYITLSGKITPYYYYNHPRYNLYNPAKYYRRHPRMAISKTQNVHKFYNRDKKFRLY